VIHIATLHHRSARWIDPQLRYLERHTGEPYRVYACLDWVDPAHFERFHFAVDRRESLVDELNFLGRVVVERAEPDDLLVFMHGDTFPIAPWVGPVREMLAAHPLAGVRRDENLGEPNPHACFTVTTPAFWHEIGGDWAKGPEWVGSDGHRTSDLGAELWRALEERSISWHPILRSNSTDLHPLWFAVYGDIVYHHGAAFRKAMSRVDAALAPPKRSFHRVTRFIALERQARRSARIGSELFEKLSRDPTFYTELAPAAGPQSRA
jgi:hypothetical protein